VRATPLPAIMACLAFVLAGGAVASPLEDGERLYQDNKPAAAISSLEKAVLEPGTDERAWLYLANCYQMLGRLDEAAATLRKGLPRAEKLKALFYKNLGDVFVLQNKNSFAADMYTQAIGADAAYAGAFLHRANARLLLKDRKGAKEDYGRYLELEPKSAQRVSIEALMAKLDAGIAEADRAAAAAEAKKQAEETARQELLDKMAASLKAAADETTSLSAGAGEVQSYDHELKLDE
jgi:tetratricopeptide (TPR) repeat protein